MTERKPPGLGFESWIDKQIREAEERGEFRDLPGAGKPLEGLGEPYDELWWVKRKLRQEGVSVLPPTLALRKEAEEVLAAAAAARSEAEVRRLIAGLNEKIREALRRPPAGPPLRLVPFDPERVVADWRAGRGRDGGDQGAEGETGPGTAR